MKKLPKFNSKVFLAPMADVTNLPFRLLCKKYGAGLVESELISADAIANKKEALGKLVQWNKKESPSAIQLFSGNVQNLIKSAKIVENKFDIIDINFGCPSKKIIGSDAGGNLLKFEERIAEIVQSVSRAIKKPLIVKIRSGFTNKHINAVRIAKICEKNGASAITLHARTVEQGYSGKADWKIIKKVKQAVKIPVIGNGDIVDGKSAKQIIDETGCDYIMIGRAAIGNPFIFKEINEFLKNRKIIKADREQKIKDYREYIQLCKEFEIFTIIDAKKRLIDFTKGIPKISRLRQRISNLKTWEEIDLLLNEFN